MKTVVAMEEGRAVLGARRYNAKKLVMRSWRSEAMILMLATVVAICVLIVWAPSGRRCGKYGGRCTKETEFQVSLMRETELQISVILTLAIVVSSAVLMGGMREVHVVMILTLATVVSIVLMVWAPNGRRCGKLAGRCTKLQTLPRWNVARLRRGPPAKDVPHVWQEYWGEVDTIKAQKDPSAREEVGGHPDAFYVDRKFFPRFVAMDGSIDRSAFI